MGVKAMCAFEDEDLGPSKKKTGEPIDTFCQFKYFFQALVTKKKKNPLIATGL